MKKKLFKRWRMYTEQGKLNDEYYKTIVSAYTGFFQLRKKKKFYVFPGLKVIGNFLFKIVPFKPLFSLFFTDLFFLTNFFIGKKISKWIISRAFYNLSNVNESFRYNTYFFGIKNTFYNIFPLRDTYYFLGDSSFKERWSKAFKKGPYTLWAWFYYSLYSV